MTGPAVVRDVCSLPDSRDGIGILCSSICIVHCLAPLALALSGVSLAGLAFFSSEEFHILFLAVVIGIASWSLLPGYRRHLVLRPLILALIGIVFLGFGVVLSENAEVPLTVTGALFMIAAHILNRQHVQLMKSDQQ